MLKGFFKSNDFRAALKVSLFWILLMVPYMLFAQDDSNVGKVLAGEHQLAEFSEGQYFIVNTNSEGVWIWFTWKNNVDGDYVVTTQHLADVHVKFTATSEPFVKFKWEKGNETRMDKIMAAYIVYIQFNCSKKDWMEAFGSGTTPPLEFKDDGKLSWD